MHMTTSTKSQLCMNFPQESDHFIEFTALPSSRTALLRHRPSRRTTSADRAWRFGQSAGDAAHGGVAAEILVFSTPPREVCSPGAAQSSTRQQQQCRQAGTRHDQIFGLGQMLTGPQIPAGILLLPFEEVFALGRIGRRWE